MKPRTVIRALAAAAIVLAAGGLATRFLLVNDTGPRPRIITPSDAHATPSESSGAHAPSIAGLTISNVTGPVERRAEGESEWHAVHAGETIAAHESLRTGSGGAALLELQDHTTVWLWPESQVSADRLDDELARIGLEGGRLDLNVTQSATRSVEVHANDGGATAMTHGARFSIIVDGAHVATVANREGEVDVLSGNGRVRVPPGMQTRARPGAAPEMVVPIPTELLLEVDWPIAPVRGRATTIRGHAPAGVLVSIDGARVVVDSTGSFEGNVPLREGENRVVVHAVDVNGHEQTRRSPPIRVDNSPPHVNSHGQWQ